MVLPCANPTKSFWIEAANSKLDRNHRSTPELPKTVDVVIIGSGYTGASQAYWMHKVYMIKGQADEQFAGTQCPSMLMLEARDICGSATGRNGGQLRPHFYSRFTPWSMAHGSETCHALIKHEAAHLDVFPLLMKEEGIATETCFKLVETADVIMSEEALTRLKNEYDSMKAAFGPDDGLVKACRLVTDPKEAERLTQIKGCIAATVHPSGQVQVWRWPYKFVHALLRIVMATGRLNLQANTPALKVSGKDAEGYITVETERGSVRTKAVIHATNRWAGHLLPELDKLIAPGRGSLGAIKAPEGLLQRTGGQIWNDTISNYHLQLPAPHNQIIIGGLRPVVTHVPELMANDREDIQFPGGPQYAKQWAQSSIVGWVGESKLDRPVVEGGVWTGVWGNTLDAFPFVGEMPSQPGNFVAAGFNGHGMPRILLTTAHLAPLVLDNLGVRHTKPKMLDQAPPLPKPFILTQQRIDELQQIDVKEWQAARDRAAARGSQLAECQKYKHMTTEMNPVDLAVAKM